MSKIVLIKGLSYRLGDTQFYRRQPVDVSDEMAEACLRTGYFETVKEEHAPKKTGKKVIVSTGKKSEAEAQAKTINHEDYGVPKSFSTKAAIVEYAKKNYNVELNTSHTAKVLYAELLVAAKQHAEANPEEEGSSNNTSEEGTDVAVTV